MARNDGDGDRREPRFLASRSALAFGPLALCPELAIPLHTITTR